jgi:tetratricopeptide (TPR) repeat protein
MRRIVAAIALSLSLLPAAPALAQSGGSAKVSISAEVNITAQAQATLADKLYAAGDYKAALKAYAEGYASYKDAAFLYAKAQCEKALGAYADAKADFEAYLALSAKASLKFKSEAEAGLSASKKALEGGVSAAVGAVGAVTGAAAGAVTGALSFAASLKISVEVSADVQVDAKSADEAYAKGSYADAERLYLAVYEKSAKPVLLYAAAQCELAQGHKAEAAGLLRGYLSASAKAKYKADAEKALKALGAASAAKVKIAVAASVDAKSKAEAKAADKLAAAGSYSEALKAYAALQAKAGHASLLYAQAQCYRMTGQIEKAKEYFGSYLKAEGKLTFKAEAEAGLKESGGTY